jgi:hypothetical protein
MVEILGGYIAESAIGREVRGQQQQVGDEGFDGIGGAALVLKVKAPGINRRYDGGAGGDVGRGKIGMIRWHRLSPGYFAHSLIMPVV